MKCTKDFYESKVKDVKKELRESFDIKYNRTNGYNREQSLQYITILKKHGFTHHSTSKSESITGGIINEIYYTWLGQSFKERCNYEIVVRIKKHDDSSTYQIHFSNKILFPRNRKGLIDNNIHLDMHTFLL